LPAAHPGGIDHYSRDRFFPAANCDNHTRTQRLSARACPKNTSETRIIRGEEVTFIVATRENGIGLARTGYFTICINKVCFNGMLTLTHDPTVFKGSIFIPPGIKGAVQVRQILIRDRLGNIKRIPETSNKG